MRVIRVLCDMAINKLLIPDSPTESLCCFQQPNVHVYVSISAEITKMLRRRENSVGSE